MNKAARYERIFQQISELVTKCTDRQARMATICAVLHHKLPYFFWTGFYMLQGERLIVSTYQGPVACMELPAGKGVCWAGILAGNTIVVPDVHRYDGHIACDSRSQSEIVVPHRNSDGAIIGILDVDSTTTGSFDETDAEWLEKIVCLIN